MLHSKTKISLREILNKDIIIINVANTIKILLAYNNFTVVKIAVTINFVCIVIIVSVLKLLI